ncbi:MAG TPA: hypothetical protein VJJ22_00510 [Candidatus Paceibacterota bacterium]
MMTIHRLAPLANRPTADTLFALASAEAAAELAGQKLGRVPGRIVRELAAARRAAAKAREPRRFAPLARRAA